MSSKIDMKSFREQQVDLKGGMVNTITFIDTKPNFIYVTNLGAGTMYVDDQPNVTDQSYEVLAGSLMKRSVVKPLGLNTLYIYADVDGKVKIESGVAELSISDIPMTQIVATLSNSLSISKVDVDSIIQSLPAGTNRVGDVGVVSMPDVNVSVLPSLPAGTNNIGDVDVVSMPDVNVSTLPSLPAGTNNIGDVDVVSMPDVNVSTLPSLPAGTNNIGDVDVVGWSSMITLLTDIKTLITTANGLLTDIKTNTGV